MKTHRLFASALLALACLSVWGCSSDGLPPRQFASSPDAATVCAPPFCLVVGTNAGTQAPATTVDAGATKPGPGAGPGADPAGPADKPKPGDKGNDPGVTMIGVPVNGTTPVTFVGGGSNGAAPLAPGCTPASALECPTKSGTCATSSTANPTSVVQGVLCTFGGTFTVASGKPAAIVEYLHETASGQNYYRFRITFDPSFVDNTYGENAIGWGDKGHTWKDLLGSDHAELELFDNTHAMVMQLKIDYIGIDTTQTCGYESLGVSGGDGKMLIGDAKWVLGSTSSLARNLEGCGYCASPACGGDCRVNSPSTDEQWSSNSSTPNWDYRVRYEVWIDAAAFGTSGFGGVNVSYVHASPSKQTNNTITVIPGPCPPPPDGCGPGTVEYLTSEGAATCVPVDSVPPTCTITEEQILTSEGAISCVPISGNPPSTGNTPDAGTPPNNTGCPEGSTTLTAKDGSTVCVPPDRCDPGSEAYLTSEGAVDCRPIRIIIY
jgi:hypothetical protein